MTESQPPARDKEPKAHKVPAVSAVFDDGRIVEMVYRPHDRRTCFAVWDGRQVEYVPNIPVDSSRVLVPYAPENNLVKNEVVLFPSEIEEYGSEGELLDEIRAFIHRYVDVSPLFETVASYYVLLTWVYDRFNELPYLRLRGDPGSGKTRFLLTMGAICYKPIFASGASTVSPLFRMLDIFRGTLIIDEADFRLSDEKAEVVKILNNGNMRGFPVLRSEVTPQKEYNPRAYQVFGPKLVATRGLFEDRALESRFLTEEMGTSRLRDDIPISLPDRYRDEARRLRNQLLVFRFRNHQRCRPVTEDGDRAIEPRLRQIFLPLMSVIDDPDVRAELWSLARRYHGDLLADRGMDVEAQVLEVIRDLLGSDAPTRLTIKEITDLFLDRHGSDYERKVTPRWIGSIVRRRLGLHAQKSDGVFVIPIAEEPKLRALYEKYGIGSSAFGEEHGEGGEDYPAGTRVGTGHP